MHLNGFAGYPFVSGIPRGQAFVDFMGRTTASPSTISPPSSPASSQTEPGNRIDYSLPPLNTSVTQLPNKGSLPQRQTDKVFADGSHSRGIRTDYPDGSASIHAVRRSPPGADGLQAVNIREVTIAPDGTQKVRARVFHVPNGAEAPSIDGAPGAKMVFSRDRTVLVDGTIIPGLTDDDDRTEAASPGA